MTIPYSEFGQTDKQTHRWMYGHYQVHYLPPLRWSIMRPSLINLNKHILLYVPHRMILVVINNLSHTLWCITLGTDSNTICSILKHKWEVIAIEWMEKIISFSPQTSTFISKCLVGRIIRFKTKRGDLNYPSWLCQMVKSKKENNNKKWLPF